MILPTFFLDGFNPLFLIAFRHYLMRILILLAQVHLALFGTVCQQAAPYHHHSNAYERRPRHIVLFVSGYLQRTDVYHLFFGEEAEAGEDGDDQSDNENDYSCVFHVDGFGLFDIHLFDGSQFSFHIGHKCALYSYLCLHLCHAVVCRYHVALCLTVASVQVVHFAALRFIEFL